MYDLIKIIKVDKELWQNYDSVNGAKLTIVIVFILLRKRKMIYIIFLFQHIRSKQKKKICWN